MQKRIAKGWRKAFETSATGANGRYSATLPGPGTYRVAWHGFTGPAVTAG